MKVLKTQSHLLVRPAGGDDFHQLAGLTHFGAYVHRHLGWTSPQDWLEKNPYLVLEKDARIVAAIALPEDYPGVTWLQFFAVSEGVPVKDSWELLLSEALKKMERGTCVIALPMQRWFRKLLLDIGFQHYSDVRLLALDQKNEHYQMTHYNSTYGIRPMNIEDLGEIQQLDKKAFDPVWRHSIAVIEAMFKDVQIATVIVNKQDILGYQMSTEHIDRGHLARLAVLPRAQRTGIGTKLVQDLIQQFHRRDISYITVTTQEDNIGSQALYHNLGFKNTDDIYTAYQIKV